MSLESLYAYSFLTIINSKFTHTSQLRRESLHAGDVKKSQFSDGRLHFDINLEKKSRDRELIVYTRLKRIRQSKRLVRKIVLHLLPFIHSMLHWELTN